MNKVHYLYGKTINYAIAGVGPCLVFVHGYLETHEVFIDFAKRFEGFTVIMPDLPGHGKSSVFREIHTMEFMADSVYEILKKENIKKCHIYGHSMGGYVALAFARKYPELLNSVGLIHSTIYADNHEKINNRKREIELLKSGKKNLVLNNMLPNIVATKNLEKHKKTIEKIIERAKQFSEAGIIAALNGMMQRPLHQIDPAIPFHLIGSTEDNFISKDVYKKISLDNPLIIHDEIANCGHASFIEQPDQAEKYILNFLNNYLS